MNIRVDNDAAARPIRAIRRRPSSARHAGFLSFLILWLVSKKSMTGAEIASELKKRKGKKPSPGTIYPVLKHLKEEHLLLMDENKSYTLTDNGKKAFEHLINIAKTPLQLEIDSIANENLDLIRISQKKSINGLPTRSQVKIVSALLAPPSQENLARR